jgi:hypothetical protein
MNWGTKIVLGLIAFMLFISAMAVYMFSVHGNDALVDEDYYEKGINYNEQYEALQNTIRDQVQPVIKISDSQVIIKLKDSAGYELKLKRPSTQKDDILDSGFTVSDANLIIINNKNMHSGLWFLELKWSVKGTKYLYKTNITL